MASKLVAQRAREHNLKGIDESELTRFLGVTLWLRSYRIDPAP